MIPLLVLALRASLGFAMLLLTAAAVFLPQALLPHVDPFGDPNHPGVLHLLRLAAPVGLTWGILQVMSVGRAFRVQRGALLRAAAMTELLLFFGMAWQFTGGLQEPLRLDEGLGPFFGALAGHALILLVVAAWPTRGEDPAPVLASASAAAPGLSGLWRIQGLLLGGLGLGLAFWPRPVARWLAGLDASQSSGGWLTVVALGASIAGLGLVSAAASGPQRVRPAGPGRSGAWSSFALLFALGLGLSAAALVSLPQQGAPTTAVGAIAGLLTLFAVANVATFLNPHWMERLVEELRRRLTLIWTLQVASFLLPALLWLVAPGVIVESLSDGTGEDARLGTDAVHLIGPMAVAMATASVLALSRVEAEFRRSIARAFVVWFGIWLLVVVYNMTGEFGQQPSRFTTAGVAALVPVALFFVPNLLVAYGATGRLRADLYAGSADSRPRGWFLWHQLQALVAFAGALLVGFFPEKAAHRMLRESARYDLASWELDQLRIHASYYAFLGAMSLLAAVQLRRWAWRQFGRWFAGWSLLWAVIFVYDYDSDIYSPAMMLLWAAVGVMGLVQAYFLSRPTVVEDLGVADSPEGLIWPDPVAAVPMAIQTATTRRRASHLYGVGAAGRLHCLVPEASEVGFPHNPYFAAGESLRATMRFANLTFEDDASMDVRGAALRLDGPLGRLDLVFNTGSFTAPRNVLEFASLVLSKWAPGWLEKRTLLSNQHLREGGIAGLRRAPESYGRLVFHSQIVRIWIGQERAEPGAGEISMQPAMYLARYRLVPLALLPPDSPPEAGTRSDDLLPESGLPDSVDAAAPWDRARRPGDGRPVDYLREELRKRLQAGPAVELLLQVQLHRADDPGEQRGSALAWYDASVDWDETVTPWQNLGRIALTQALSAAETERLRFNPAHHPLNFGVPEAVSLLDPRSLGASELRVMSAISSLRTGLAAVLGLPVEEGR